jgi:acetyl esterase/lipase
VFGRPHHYDQLNERVAEHCEVAVVSVDYRLAPEHPHPAALDDCVAAARWLIEHAATEFGCERLLIGGESAGAHLSVLTLLRLRDQHNYRGFLAANLQFGAFDLTLTPSARRWGGRNLILNTPLIEWFVECLVPSVADRSDPAVSPLYADLAGLPPALFTVGTLDPLLDDSLFMHSRWLAAGNRSSLALYPGGIHGFNFFPTALGQQANQRCLEFLRASLDGAEAGDGG